MRKMLLAAALALAFAMPCTADQKDDRIAQLESEVEMLKERIAELEGTSASASQDVGEGDFYIVNESGNTKDGNTIVIYATGPNTVTGVGITARKMNGALLSYIYVDGVLQDKKQLANTDSNLQLTGDLLAFGTHTVEVKQYENDDESTEPVFVRSAQYEVKQK